MPPALLALDLMDTVVRDPFFHELPRRLGRSIEQLFRLLDGQAWVAFETGAIDESTYLRRMFSGSPPGGVSAEEVRDVIVGGYAFVDEMAALLGELSGRSVRLWVLSNYSPWADVVRRQLDLDRFVEGYVVSHATGVRKPDPRAYLCLLQQARVAPADVLFIDDRQANVEAARSVGMAALRFVDTPTLRRQLRRRGVL